MSRDRKVADLTLVLRNAVLQSPDLCLADLMQAWSTVMQDFKTIKEPQECSECKRVYHVNKNDR